MMRYRDQPIQRKLLLSTLGICGAVLLVASVILLLYQTLTFRTTVQQDLATVAQIITANSAAAVAAKNQQAASEILGALKAMPFILCACLTDKNGKIMAHHGEGDDREELKEFPPPGQFRFLGGHLLYTQPVWLNQESMGSLYLRANYQHVFLRPLRVFGLVTLGILVASAALAIPLSERMQRSITNPIVQLARAARLIAEKQDYSVRAAVSSRGDELGDLANSFNQMLDRIQTQDAALRDSEARYRLLIENQGEGAGVVNAAEVFTLANPAADAVFGVPPGTLVGRSLREFLSDADFARMQAETQKRERGQKGTYEVEILRPDGEHRLLLVTANPTHVAGQFAGTFGVFHDITERKRAEAELRQRYQAERLLGEISQQFITLPSHQFGGGIDSSLQALGEFARADRACLFTMSEDHRHGSNTNEWCAPGIPPFIHRMQQVPAADFPWLLARLSSQTVVLVSEVSALPREASPERAFLQARGVQSVLAVPLTLGGTLRGFIGFDAVREPRTWTETDCQILMLASQIFVNALERQRADHEVEQLNQRLIASSRHAGMAEVATGVLHNVGNVLNSVNVSATLVADRLRKSKTGSLSRAIALLSAHQHDLPAFLTSDRKGLILPGYLKDLAAHLQAEQAALLKEIEQLTANVSHIKEIVATQQSHACVAGVLESLSAQSLVEDALRINSSAFARHDIKIVQRFVPTPLVLVDRHKVLQILVNLLSNAQHALVTSAQLDRHILLSVETTGDRVRIVVGDNGIGIAPDILIRIFQHGFTTRKDGHGFGLHSGANAAREMGGTLSVHSEGLGKGATFVLELPITSPPPARAAAAAPTSDSTSTRSRL